MILLGALTKHINTIPAICGGAWAVQHHRPSLQAVGLWTELPHIADVQYSTRSGIIRVRWCINVARLFTSPPDLSVVFFSFFVCLLLLLCV